MQTREAYIKGMIRRRYARHAVNPNNASGGRERAFRAGYDPSQLDSLPGAILERWSGCGNVVAGAPLKGARLIVDIGAGGCADALLARSQPKSTADVVAIDITPEMLGPPDTTPGLLCVVGDFEFLPLADAICDVVIANAAFNLALDPTAAFAEAWRILRPGGRLHICDLVREGELPAELMADPLGWSTSLGGVMLESELVQTIQGAGFKNVTVTGHRPFPPVIAVHVDAEKPGEGAYSHDA